MSQENNKKLLEATLDKVAAQMFMCCHLSPAEWDFDKKLRRAFQRLGNTQKFLDITRNYDKTINLAKDAKIKLKDKYYFLYDLTSNTDNYEQKPKY
jgi:glycerol dehydrogenase-like iron-containing ADH family enzyme